MPAMDGCGENCCQVLQKQNLMFKIRKDADFKQGIRAGLFCEYVLREAQLRPAVNSSAVNTALLQKASPNKRIAPVDICNPSKMP